MSKFLNTAILDFNISGGFGASDINLDVSLAECYFDSPAFTAPILGAPYEFVYNSFTFYGIMDTWKQDKSSSGYTYSVQMNNGLHVIGGVEIILNDYYGGTYSVPNLLNVFGYMENTGGFGASNVNSAGMSWIDIKNTVTTLVNNITGNSYGGPINYKGYKYKIDLSQLPAIPAYYRINNDSINLVDFISEICSAGGCDFFIKLVKPTSPESEAGWSGTFTVVTISRTDEPTTGKIAEFIESSDCVISQNYGLETRKDVHSKFVVGANIEQMYFNYPQNSEDNDFDGGEISALEYENDTVLPFFGVDSENNVIVGYTPSGQELEYYFDIDVSDINTPLNTGTYTTCLGELQAARKGRSTWEVYIGSRDNHQYVINPTGTSWAYYRTTEATSGFDLGDGYYAIPKYGYIEYARLKSKAEADAIYGANNKLTYRHSNIVNPYFQRATKFRIPNGMGIRNARMTEDDLYTKSLSNSTLSKIYQSFRENLGILDGENQLLRASLTQKSSRYIDSSLGNFSDNKTDQLYRRIKGIADTYYNKKFMVTIPFTLAAYEPESYNIRMSQEVANEGYLDETAWPVAYASGYLPDVSGINTLLTPDYKFHPFVKFENCVVTSGISGPVMQTLYDFSEIGNEDKIFSTPVPYTSVTYPTPGVYYVYDCWIKCRVDEKIYFRDSQTLYGPRAVIEVPGSVKLNYSDKYPTYARALLESYTIAKATGGAFYYDTTVDETFLKKTFDKVGSDDAFMHQGEEIVYANLYAIPLRSKLLSYGPWYAIGASGKVSYERNQELNPWNYGGFTAMNQAGNARVTDGITNQTFSEVGNVQVVGAPTFNFGDAIVASGPYITSIDCTFGSQGTTSNYTLQAWSSHRTLTKLNNFIVDRNKRISGVIRELKSNFREGLKNGRFKNAGDFYQKISNRFIDVNDYTRRDRPSTSSKMISAEINGSTSMVAIQPLYNAAAQSYTNYQNKALVSLDNIFAPFSTVEKSGWPNLIIPNSSVVGSGDISSYTLNPYRKDTNALSLTYGNNPDTQGILRGSGEQNSSFQSFSNYRGVGLKLPMIGIGWGYDINGSPVPSGSDGKFAENFAYDVSKWKAGPIDFRWDEDRGVWTMPKGGDLTIRFRIVASYFCGECYVDARVISVPFGVSISELPDVDQDNNNAVRIYDRTGRYFNEPPEDLVNRIGYAVYMKPLEDGPCPDTIFPSWECISLPCNEVTCD